MAPTGTIEIDSAIVPSFEGELHSRTIGSLMVVRVCADTFRFVRDAEAVRRTGRDHVFVNVLECGQFAGHLNGREISVGPGGVFFSCLAGPQNLEIRDATWFGLVVPSQLLDAHMRWPRSLDGKVFAATTAEAVLFGHYLRSLMALPAPLADRNTKRIARLTVSHLAECLGLRPLAADNAGKFRSVDATAVRRFIARRLGDRHLGPDLICRSFAISRSSLYRLLGESGGIQSMVLAERLQAVHRDIASGRFAEQSLKAIASRRGVGDMSGFRRAFVKKFGYTPFDLRACSRRERGPTIPSQAEAISDIEQWFEA